MALSDASKRAPALIFNSTAALRLAVWTLGVDVGVALVMRTLGDTSLDDDAAAMFEDISAPPRSRHTDQDVRKFRAKFKLVQARAGRFLSAKPPAVFASAQLTKAVLRPDANGKWA